MTISQRILEVVKLECNGNKSEFARRIGVTPAYISKLGKNPSDVPSDRTIMDICRLYDVNEEWLREGKGEMFRQRSQDEKLATFFADVNLSDDNDFRKRFLSALSELEPDGWKVIEELMKKCMNEETHE